MLKSSIVGLVAWSVRHPARVIALALVSAVLSSYYVAHYFKTNTEHQADKEWSGLD